MNANAIPPKKSNARLNRIKTASRIIRLLNIFFFIVGATMFIEMLLGWTFFFPGRRIVISDNHIYRLATEMPSAIFALWLVKNILGLVCMVVFNFLFRLYEQGILFSAKNILYLRFLGYGLIINWAIDYQLQSSLHDMDLSATPVFAGLLIIFIAWIMDEGRKIKEEQELTV